MNVDLGPNEHEEKKLCKDPDLFELLRNDVSDRLCLLQDDEPDGHDADEAGDRDPLFRDVFEPGEHDGGSKNDQGSSRGAPVILLKETEKQVPRDDADDDSERYGQRDLAELGQEVHVLPAVHPQEDREDDDYEDIVNR